MNKQMKKRDKQKTRKPVLDFNFFLSRKNNEVWFSIK